MTDTLPPAGSEAIVRQIIAKHYPDYTDGYKGRRITIGMEAYAKGWHAGLHDLRALDKEEDAYRIDRQAIEEAFRARLLEALKNTPALKVDVVRTENYSGEHRRWLEPITFPSNADFYEVVLKAVFEADRAGQETQNGE